MSVNTSGQTTYTYKSLNHSLSQYYSRLQNIHSYLGYRTPQSNDVTPKQFLKVAYERSGKDIKTIQNGRSVTIDKLPVILQLYVTLVHMNYKNEMFYDMYRQVATYNQLAVEPYRTDKYVRYIDMLVTLLSSNKITLDRSSDGVVPLLGNLPDPKKNLLQLIQLLVPYQADPTLLKLPDKMLERIYRVQNEGTEQSDKYDRSARYESEFRVFEKRSVIHEEYRRLMEKLTELEGGATTITYESAYPELNQRISKYNRDLLSLSYTDDVDDLVPLEYIQNRFLDDVEKTIDSTGSELDNMVDMLRALSVRSVDKQITIPYYSVIPEYITVLVQIKQDIGSHERAIQLFRTSEVFDRDVSDASSDTVKNLVTELSRNASSDQEYKRIVKDLIGKNKASLANIKEHLVTILSGARELFLSETAIVETTKEAFLTKYKDILVPYSEAYPKPPIHSFLLLDMGIENESDLGDNGQVRSSIRSHLKKRFLSSIRDSIDASIQVRSVSTETLDDIKQYISDEVKKNQYSIEDIRLLQNVFTGVDVSGGKGGDTLHSILKHPVVIGSIPVSKQERMAELVDEIQQRSNVPPDKPGYFVSELIVYVNIVLMDLPDTVYSVEQYIYRIMLIHKNSYPYYLTEDEDDMTGGGDDIHTDTEIDGISLDNTRTPSSSKVDGEAVLYKRYIENQMNQVPVLKKLMDELQGIYNFTYIELINYAKEQGILANFLDKYESNMADVTRTTVQTIPLKRDPRYDTLRRLGEMDLGSGGGGDYEQIPEYDEDEGDNMVGLFSYLKTDCIRHHSEKITDFLVKQKGDEFSILDPTTDTDTLSRKVSETFQCVFDNMEEEQTYPLYREMCQNPDLTDTKRQILTLFDYHDIDNTKLGTETEADDGTQTRGIFLSNAQLKDMYGLKGTDTELYTTDGYISQKTKTYLLEEHNLFMSLHEHNGVKGVQVHYRTDDMKERILSLSNFLECVDDFHKLVHSDSPMLFMRNHGFIEEIEKVELSRLLADMRKTIDVTSVDVGDTVVDSMENVWIISRTDGGSGVKTASIQTLSDQTLDTIYSFNANMIKEFNNKLDLTIPTKKSSSGIKADVVDVVDTEEPVVDTEEPVEVETGMEEEEEEIVGYTD